MLIEDREVRGVASAGMLCSAWDLGWVPEPDGVLVELPLDLMPGDLCPADAPADVSLRLLPNLSLARMQPRKQRRPG